MQSISKNIVLFAKILTGVLLLFCIGCEEDIEIEGADRLVYDEESEAPLVQFLSDITDKENQTFQPHIRKITTYTKIPFSRLPLKDFNKDSSISGTTRVLVITNTEKLNKTSFKKVVSFVNKGGTVFLPIISEGPKFAFLAGLFSDADFTVDPIARGFNFKNNFIPGLKDVNYDNKTVHGALKAENFSNNIEVLATAFNVDETPTIVRKKIGKGFIIAINSDQEGRKQDRGLYFASLLSALQNVPYPIVNASALYLDDYPSPTYELVKEPIKTEFNISETDFYTKIWWPDMVKLANEKQLKYTALVCFDYRNFDTPPFLFSEWDKTQDNSSDRAMRNVLAENHELGFHGYNHISLFEKDWQNPDFMEISLLSAQKKWKSEDYGQLPISYVPPSNEIDSLGLSALSAAFPSLEYNCSIYLGEFDEGGDREFDREPYNNHFFNFPRVTSGYLIRAGEQFDLQSMYLYTGIWTHFIHPDDVYQIPDESNTASRGDYDYRNNESLGWRTSKDGSEGLLPIFKKYLQKFENQYPLQRSFKVKDAAKLTEDWRNTSFEHQQNTSVYTVSAVEGNALSKPYYWFVYRKNENYKQFESWLQNEKYIFSKTELLDGYLYNIETNKAQISIPLERKKEAISEINANRQLDSLLSNYDKFERREPNFETVYDEIAFLESEGKIEEAIVLLLNKIRNSETVTPLDYQLLYKYYGWTNRETEFYQLLESEYRRTGNSRLIAISKQIGEQNGYPSEEIQKIWMERQVRLYPNDLALREAYILYFGTADEQEQLSASLAREKFQQATSPEEKATYILSLIENDSDIILSYLTAIEPCNDASLIDLAPAIPQYFADKEMYQKALEWSKCTDGIAAETITSWRVANGEYQFLKETDFAQYITQLVQNEPNLVTKELINVEPCSQNFEDDILYTIAYAFADQGSYRYAFLWSQCMQDFDVKEQLQWLASMQAVDEMEEVYNNYIKNNPSDFETKLTMARLYSELGFISKSWKLANSLPSSEELKPLRAQLNQDVLYISETEQKDLLNNHEQFFYPEVKEQLIKQLRLNNNDFQVSESNLLTDRFQPTSLTNQLGYGLYSKTGNQHTFGITQNRAYSLRLDSVAFGNTPLSLYGLYYGFKSKEKEAKPTYSAKANIEMSDASKVYYQAEAGIAFSKDSLYSSAVVSFRPAITAPAYNLGIYRAQLSIYEEYAFNKKWQVTANFEGNYYTDEVLDGLLSSILNYNYMLSEKNSINPYAEAAGMLGNTDYSLGYPYWTIEERLYGGLGIGYKYMAPKKYISISVDAATFLDTFSDSFQRYRANVNVPLFEYFFVNFNAEFYTLENFYSNNFTLGLRYHFKN